MIRDLEKNEFNQTEGIIDFPLFNLEIQITIDEGVPLEYAKQCVSYLQNLDDSVIDKLCEGSIRYCESMREYFADEGIDIPKDVKGREILRYIRPNVLLIDPPEDDTIAFHIEGNCDWEPEHGIEGSIRNGKVLYVGAFNDESPWRSEEYFAKASWNYAVFE